MILPSWRNTNNGHNSECAFDYCDDGKINISGGGGDTTNSTNNKHIHKNKMARRSFSNTLLSIRAPFSASSRRRGKNGHVLNLSNHSSKSQPQDRKISIDQTVLTGDEGVNNNFTTRSISRSFDADVGGFCHGGSLAAAAPPQFLNSHEKGSQDHINRAHERYAEDNFPPDTSAAPPLARIVSSSEPSNLRRQLSEQFQGQFHQVQQQGQEQFVERDDFGYSYNSQPQEHRPPSYYPQE